MNPKQEKATNLAIDGFSRKVAEPKGLEPSASGVTGRRYNQLNYGSAYIKRVKQRLVSEVVGGTGLEPVTLGL